MDAWEKFLRGDGQRFKRPQEDMESVSDILKKDKAKDILDLGCGHGRHTQFLAKKGFRVHAVDSSKEALRLTKDLLEREGLKASLDEASCYQRLPFKDRSFDAVISVQTIHHGTHEDITGCIKEISRVLKPGGVIFITVPSGNDRDGTPRYEGIAPFIHIPGDGDEKGIPHFIYDLPLLKEDFRGFSILDLHIDKGGNFCMIARRNPGIERKEI